jgi:hypothetical protein
MQDSPELIKTTLKTKNQCEALAINWPKARLCLPVDMLLVTLLAVASITETASSPQLAT